MRGTERPVVGQIFYVPLYEGGYAFGYVSLMDKTTITLCSFFDIITETPEPPANLADLPLVLEDLRVGGAEFMQRKRYPELRWIAIDQYVPGEVKAKHTRFIMRSRPAFQLVDLADKSSKRVATEEEIARYPDLSVPFPPVHDQAGRKGGPSPRHRCEADRGRSRRRDGALTRYSG